MNRIKKGSMIVLAIFVLIQFFQPARNRSSEVSKAGIATVIRVPSEVQAILQNSCYDCHSNNTRYPWYAVLQPGAWWLASHIKEGKAELNFDEFGEYSKRRQRSKLKSIQGSIEDKSMPLPSYKAVHREADLSQTDQKLLNEWLEGALNEISN
ncbi:heme-binding domain-containing protein [Daejeonella lutea]|uniref:Haem-binding domain-containing protein n=1 Tax=Daejeonella lutea TaxID=572036 RepID=A0A1T5AB09_9SPHI|nr:heme-binding domain-containing protein [Daejeonella lutea]SKB32152.1 Haem-binding domain-containing protein [Daejeonella lutea]